MHLQHVRPDGIVDGEETSHHRRTSRQTTCGRNAQEARRLAESAGRLTLDHKRSSI